MSYALGLIKESSFQNFPTERRQSCPKTQIRKGDKPPQGIQYTIVAPMDLQLFFVGHDFSPETGTNAVPVKDRYRFIKIYVSGIVLSQSPVKELYISGNFVF